MNLHRFAARDPILTPLEDHVRHGLTPNEPQVLYEYLQLCDEVGGERALYWRRNLYRRAFTTLICAVSDAANPMHWRRLCLDHVYRPIQALHRCARSAEDLREVRACTSCLQHTEHALRTRD